MQPIDDLDQATARKIRGVLFDLDDTLFDHRRLSEVAYGALNRLHEAGLVLLAVTGRPVGYGEVLVPAWPISGLVAENGAIAVLSDARGRLQLIDEADPELRAERHARVVALASEIQSRFGLLPATDVHLRRCDFTFDIGEYQQVDDARVAAASAFARSRGALTVRSTVHLHVSYDGSDKATGTLRILASCFGFDETHARDLFAFIGDSENDEAAFAAFHTTIAVSNLRGRPTVSPKFVTRGARGQGFAEFAQKLITLRQSTASSQPNAA
jgi:HAD superfamily hydrolase (TIGR01484 family)